MWTGTPKTSSPLSVSGFTPHTVRPSLGPVTSPETRLRALIGTSGVTGDETKSRYGPHWGSQNQPYSGVSSAREGRRRRCHIYSPRVPRVYWRSLNVWGYDSLSPPTPSLSVSVEELLRVGTHFFDPKEDQRDWDLVHRRPTRVILCNFFPEGVLGTDSAPRSVG